MSDDDEEEPQPTAKVNGGEPRPNVDPNPDTLNSGDWELCGWKLQEDFDPLPLVPPHENTHNFKMLSTIELFEKYIPNHSLQSIADATSTNIMANTGKPMVLTSTDISKFFVVTLVMSYLKYPRIRVYWQRKTQVSQVADNMTRTKYFIIRNNLRVREYADVPNQEKDSEKFWKVGPK